MEYLDKIHYLEIRDFVKELVKDRSAIKNNLSKEVFEATYFLLKSEKMISGQGNSIYADIILAGAALHNIGATRYQIEKDVCSLFKHRNILRDVDCSSFIKESVIPQVSTVIESQLGKNTPIAQLIPNYGSPGFFPAMACTLVYGGKWHNENIQSN